MLQLSTAAILEKNKISQDSAWITLLEIRASDQTIIRICHNTEDITWGGELWIAFPFTIDSVRQTKNEVPQVPVKISNITRVIEQYIEQYAGFVGCTVILRVVNSKHLDLSLAEVEETFTVQHTNSDANWATFNLGGSLPLMMRFPFRRILKDWCPFTYKDIECAATAMQADCPHTLQGCRARNNSIRFGGEPSMAIGGIYASNN